MASFAKDCQSARNAIAFLLDDELDAEQSIELEAHLAECPECRMCLEQEGQLRLTLRRAVRDLRAPESLRRRVSEIMDNERRAPIRWRRLVPSLAAAGILLAFLWPGAHPGSSRDIYEAAVRHAQNLPFDVEAADVGQLQSFFRGKLPFPVRLPQLVSVPGTRLGGRVTNLGNRDVAYVRYELPQGQLSFFVYEDPNPEVPENESFYRMGGERVYLQHVHGYTVARWNHGGVLYSVVTDLPDDTFSSVLFR
jgi:anti-sigma factor (TIGR02949 family)